MYTIQVKVSTDKDIQMIANQIAQIIESSTGQKCNVSVMNKRINKQHQQAEYKQIEDKLKNVNNV